MVPTLALALVAAAVSAAGAAEPVPKLLGHVNDYAHVLPANEARELERRLTAYESETTNQAVLLTVPTLHGDDFRAYAQRVFAEWKLGQKEQRNGVLMLNVTQEHRVVRIHTGYGLEGALPDMTCGQITDEMVPFLKAGKYYDAYELGFRRIAEAARGEFTAKPKAAGAKLPWSGGATAALVALLILCVILGEIHPGVAAVFGGIGGIGFALVVFAAGVGGAVLLAVLGAVVGAMANPVLKGMAEGGIGSGGGGGGGWSGGGGGSSSYSGGGGSSGGGGGDSSY